MPSESINRQVLTLINGARQTLRLRHSWNGLWRGFLYGAAALALCIVIYKVAPVPPEILYFGAALCLVIPVAALIYGFSRPVTLEQAARYLDAKAGSAERFATFLEFQKSQRDWLPKIEAETSAAAAQAQSAALWKPSLPQVARYVMLVLAVTATLGFVPEYRSKKYLAKQQEQQNLKDTGEQLALFARRTLENKPPALPTTRQALEQISELGTNLATLTQADALKEVSAVKNALEEKLKEMQQAPPLKPLKSDDRQSLDPTAAREQQRTMKELEAALGKNTPESISNLKSDMKSLQDLARKAAADPNSAEAGQAGAAMEALAQKASQMGVSPEGLAEAIDAFKSGKFDQAAAKLDAAMREMEKMQAMAEALQNMKKNAVASSSSLPEQIENGEGDAARQRLTDMMQKLSSGSASPQEISKMMEEVAKAAAVSKDYEKLAKHLQDASKAMSQTQASQAVQQLAEAKKEIENLMQQSADMQALMDNLQALQKAQMAVSTGRSWGECKNPGFGPGGKPGRGVGTWTDDTGMLEYPEMSELWDNSNINRPDMDGRGHTDRGDMALSDKLDATRLKGQINPGAAMPSVSIKGLHIKGQSSVQYQEAVTAAQQEAQNALNHDQVPRAYQGAVKNYFDDLKK